MLRTSRKIDECIIKPPHAKPPKSSLKLTPNHPRPWFEVGDFTSLKELDITTGSLVPDFKPDTYEYYVLLSADTTPDMLLKEGPALKYTPNTPYTPLILS